MLQKTIELIAQGHKQKLATPIFNLNKLRVHRWCLRYTKDGHIRPSKNLGKKP